MEFYWFIIAMCVVAILQIIYNWLTNRKTIYPHIDLSTPFMF